MKKKADELQQELMEQLPELQEIKKIGQRIAFAVAAQSGRLASELDDDTPATREIAALAAEIEHLEIGRAAS